MADIPPIYVKIEADVNDLKNRLADAEKALKGLDDNVKKTDSGFASFTNRLKSVGAALGATFAATQVVSFFKQSVAAAIEAEQAQTRLATILKTTGGATEAQIAALNAQAEALEKVGVVSKDNITVTQSQLATFDLQGKTISKLTPAILDYVTAEKGATASSEDYKQMTNGLAQALNGNFASLTRVGFVLDEETKKKIKSGTESERAAALVEVLNSTYKGFNKTLADTPEGRMVKLQTEFGNLKQEIGGALLPAFMSFTSFLRTAVIPALNAITKFVKENIDGIKAAAIVIGIGTTAWALYNVQQKLATLTLAKFNEVLKKNAFGLIITAVALLVGWLVQLYKGSERFRNAVNAMAKVALNAFASIVPMIAKVGEAIAKLVTGPLRGLLTGLSKLPGVGKYAKGALDAFNKGLDGISDMGDAAAKKAKELAAGLDKVGKEADKTKGKLDKVKKGGDVWAGTKDPSLGMSKEEQKRLDKLKDYKEKATEVLKDMADVRAEAAEDMAQAEAARDEKIADARKVHAERLIDIERDYQRKRTDIQEAYDDKIADLEQDAQKKREEILANGQAKLTEIVEKGRQRLRDAWESGTSFSLADLFAGAKEKGGDLLGTIKEQLVKVRDFQKGLADLAGKGYTQTFIEQVAKAGPVAGAEMLAGLKKLSPEQEKELQDLYIAMEDLSQTGMDRVAETLSTSSSFATAELAKAYDDTKREITRALNEVDETLKENIAEATKTYNKAMAEAERIRDEALADADKALKDAIEEANKNFEKSIDDINARMTKKLAELKEKLAEIAADLAAIGAADVAKGFVTAGDAIIKAPVTPYTPPVTSPQVPVRAVPPSDSVASWRAGEEKSMAGLTLNQTFNSVSADAWDIHEKTLSAIRYGQAVTPKPIAGGGPGGMYGAKVT